MKFNEITSVFKTNNGIAYFCGKFENNIPVPVLIEEKKKIELFLTWYKKNKIKEKKPEDRVISGIEDINEFNCYCEETFQKAMKRSMTASEKINHKGKMSLEELEFLWAANEFGIATRYIREIILTNLSKMNTALKKAGDKIMEHEHIELELLREVIGETPKIVQSITKYNIKFEKLLGEWMD